MKKIFAVLAIIAVTASCNSSEEKTTVTDSTKTENPLMDANNVADTVKMIMDSTHNMPDSIKK